jgi:hypothetical protein
MEQPPKRSPKERPKMGSVVWAGLTGVLLVVAAVSIFYTSSSGGKNDLIDTIKANPKPVDGGACALFGIVLIWWAVGAFRHAEKNWGIGFPTVTMVVGVVTALIAIFSLLHP